MNNLAILARFSQNVAPISSFIGKFIRLNALHVCMTDFVSKSESLAIEFFVTFFTAIMVFLSVHLFMHNKTTENNKGANANLSSINTLSSQISTKFMLLK